MSRWHCVWEHSNGEIAVGSSYKTKRELLIYNHARSVHKDRKEALQAAALLLRERQIAYINFRFS